MRVLIVEDEPKLASLLRKGLTAQGLAADVATDADEAMWMAASTAYDAITLDVMLPGTDGFTLCRDFRRQGVTTPVLMITALDTIHDRVPDRKAAGWHDNSSPRPRCGLVARPALNRRLARATSSTGRLTLLRRRGPAAR